MDVRCCVGACYLKTFLIHLQPKGRQHNASMSKAQLHQKLHRIDPPRWAVQVVRIAGLQQLHNGQVESCRSTLLLVLLVLLLQLIPFIISLMYKPMCHLLFCCYHCKSLEPALGSKPLVPPPQLSYPAMHHLLPAACHCQQLHKVMYLPVVHTHLGGSVIIWDVHPEPMADCSWHTLPQGEGVPSDKVSTFPVGVVQRVEEIGSRRCEQVADVLLEGIDVLQGGWQACCI
jgi:hypothetical protein